MDQSHSLSGGCKHLQRKEKVNRSFVSFGFIALFNLFLGRFSFPDSLRTRVFDLGLVLLLSSKKFGKANVVM